jgi:hypothetical protein
MILVVLCAGRVAVAEPPSDHVVGLVGGAGANISSTGGVLFELGLHVRDVVALSGDATLMGEWYQAMIEGRWFPTNGEWRPCLTVGIGQMNEQDLFEDFLAIGVGGEHRSSSGHWALYGEAAVDQPYSARRNGMATSANARPYGSVGLRFYY